MIAMQNFQLKGGQDDDLGHCVKNLDQEPRKKALKTDNLKKRIYAQPLGRNQAEVSYTHRKQKKLLVQINGSIQDRTGDLL
jgi:hypothetical protein